MTQELATRSNDVCDVILSFDDSESEFPIIVDLHDRATGETWHMFPPSEKANDVFEHPFAYINRVPTILNN